MTGVDEPVYLPLLPICTCVPVKLVPEVMPDFLAQCAAMGEGPHIEMPCPVCEQSMYVGPRSIAMAEQGRMQLLCMYCTIRLFPGKQLDGNLKELGLP